jgi:hypothetical protein
MSAAWIELRDGQEMRAKDQELLRVLGERGLVSFEEIEILNACFIMIHSTETALCPGDTPLIVCVQNDLPPKGPLAVPHGDEVVPVLNRYVRQFTGV